MRRRELLYARRLTKKREGRRRRAALPYPETTIKTQSIRRAQGASLAAIVLAGAAAAVQAQPSSPRYAAPTCQTGGKAGSPKQACANAQRLEVAAVQRRKPDLATQRECRVLGSAILESEQAERRARAAMMESIQQDLFILRKRFRKLGC